MKDISSNVPAVAVIMSVYNEPLQYVKEAIDSILNQTFQNFEIVVVNDNPSRSDYKQFIASYQDSRIIFHQNETNLFLAGSMNVAASLVSAKYLARMDADDIAEPDRLEKEYNILNTGNYDLVFSRYSYIDQNSRPCLLDKEVTYYPPEKLIKVMLEKVVIHHPTVMMTSEILHKVGGYRNFMVAQDRDLWLRMQYAGCRFYMLEDSLLKYRVSEESVSSKKWHRQLLTIFYIEKLFVERLHTGKDSFSTDNCESFLKANGLGNLKAENKLRRANRMIAKAIEFQQVGENLTALLYRVIVFFFSKQYRQYYINRLQKRKLLRQLVYGNR